MQRASVQAEMAVVLASWKVEMEERAEERMEGARSVLRPLPGPRVSMRFSAQSHTEPAARAERRVCRGRMVRTERVVLMGRMDPAVPRRHRLSRALSGLEQALPAELVHPALV